MAGRAPGPVEPGISETSPPRRKRDAVERSRTRHKQSRSRSGTKRTSACPMEMPRERHAEYGFDPRTRDEPRRSSCSRTPPSSLRTPLHARRRTLVETPFPRNSVERRRTRDEPRRSSSGRTHPSSPCTPRARRRPLVETPSPRNSVERRRTRDEPRRSSSSRTPPSSPRTPRARRRPLVETPSPRNSVERIRTTDEPQSKRSRTGGRGRSRSRSGRRRTTAAPTKMPREIRVKYGFNPAKFSSKRDALRSFLMRLVGPKPGETSSLYSWETVQAEDQLQSTLTLDSRCCEKIWPKEGPTKCFVGAKCNTKVEAMESAAKRFWDDPAVKRKAATLPPSKRVIARLANSSNYMARERFTLEAKERNRLKFGC